MSTLTHRVAAILVKSFHLQYRMKKIFDDQELLFSKLQGVTRGRETIRIMGNAAYSTIDMITAFEHIFQLVNDMFCTREIKVKLDSEATTNLGKARKIAQKWKPVRNVLGGHIDIEIVESFYKKHNYVGIFISNDLEADISMLNMLLVESALNSARSKSDILGRDLDFKNNGIPGEIKLLVDSLNKDWNEVFGCIDSSVKYLYKIGKAEKIENSNPQDLVGIVID